jgi:nucleotide-binding universal stress UspA family protein
MARADGGQPTPESRDDSIDRDLESVLLATDGGEAGDAAVRWLALRATVRRLDVEVLTVVEFDPLNNQYYGDDLTTGAEEVVRRAREDLVRAAPTGRVRTAVATGDARDVFESASAAFDLLVVGSNHDSPWRGLFGNSFSVKMAEGARCPVVVVPRNWQPSEGPVVAGVRGDDTDEAPLTFALTEARAGSRSLRLVHARATPRVIGVPAGRLSEHEADDDIVTSITARLRSLNTDLHITGELVQGDPAESLLMRSGDARLLVVGSHTRTGFDRFFLGSVSRDVLLEPPCAVAVIRPTRVGRPIE